MVLLWNLAGSLAAVLLRLTPVKKSEWLEISSRWFSILKELMTGCNLEYWNGPQPLDSLYVDKCLCLHYTTFSVSKYPKVSKMFCNIQLVLLYLKVVSQFCFCTNNCEIYLNHEEKLILHTNTFKHVFIRIEICWKSIYCNFIPTCAHTMPYLMTF